MKSLVIEKIKQVLKDIGIEQLMPFDVSVPPPGHKGDYASNVAMVYYKTVAAVSEVDSDKRRGTTTARIFPSTLDLAKEIALELEKDRKIEKVDVASPGFINIALKKELYLDELKKITEQKGDYGKNSIGLGKKINVEYVSANPTGPLHIGNARSGPIGEAFANFYEFNGYEVVREFLVNDRGTQIERFGKSLLYWYEIKKDPDIEFPEGGYPAPYIKELSDEIQKKELEKIKTIKETGKLIDFFAKEGLKIMVQNIKSDLELIQIKFDIWTYETEIVKSGKPKITVEELSKKGYTTEKDGAIWFKNPEDPELLDKEAVLVKSDREKSLTYFATDIAYHKDKIARGADKLIDVWGSNHAGHIPKMKAAMRALGYQDEILEIIVYQYVRLKKSGKAVSMGKRLGNFITLKDVIESGVHPDAFKYFILSQNANTPIDFDIDLAADTSERNPVFYIKYAHARIASILRKAEESGVEGSVEGADFALLKNNKEVALYKELVKFPEIITEISENFQIQSLPHYAYKISGLFHDFYGSCKVISEDKRLTAARLSLAIATKIIIANSLKILGIEAPEKM